MPMFAFSRSGPGTYAARPINARDADREYRNTDAGVIHGDFPRFIVIAHAHSAALDGGARWLECWADANDSNVPDDLALEERSYQPGKSYMILRVL